MMRSFETDLVQNPVLGATALFSFAQAYFESTASVDGPELPSVFLVLPIAYHRKTADAIGRMRRESGVLKALREFPEMVVDLQQRVEELAAVGFEAIDLLLGTGLATWDPAEPWPRLVPSRKELPTDLKSDGPAVATIIGASKRLGWWLARAELPAVCAQLGVRF